MATKINTFFANYKYGFHTDTKSSLVIPKGLNEKIVRQISEIKEEPKWMTDFRVKAYKEFVKKPLPSFGPSLEEIDLQDIHYYIRPQDKTKNKWEDVPTEIKETFDRLGIPEHEKEMLSGTGAQFESEMIYHSIKDSLSKKGIIFESIDAGLKKYPELFKEYFGKIVPYTDNKFAALNSAVWSGGSFIYIPKNTHVDLPLEAYFRINTESMGQFERTLIIVDEGSFLHYMEGCTAPIYSKDSLHAAVVEIIVKKNAHVQYTTIQNWSNNIYNLVTKRAFAYENAEMIWLDCNIGSKITMKYPAIYLLGDNAKGEIKSLAIAKDHQYQDTGGKIIHAAKNTTSKIIAKSISKDHGTTIYRGLVKATKSAKNSFNYSKCDALILDKNARSDTIPKIQIDDSTASVAHEASIFKIDDTQLFYLMSRGIPQDTAISEIVNGFANPIINELPTQYAVELKRLLQIETQ
ncbi:MAG: Fe-S cluster assembly protein SufB [Candidatus Gracilibacteria bacterium]|jgi:Fe-S cluster assembly protein SufB